MRSYLMASAIVCWACEIQQPVVEAVPAVVEEAPPYTTAPPTNADPNASTVHVYTGKASDQACEVLGVLDFHSRADSQDKGFEQLRARAAQLGADAVISAEFEHGHDGELSHLSGIAARCRETL